MVEDSLKVKVKKRPIKNSTSKAIHYDMIVFCHVRWEFVYQRPQHIISRISKEMKVLMIEEPVDYEIQEENSGNLIVVSNSLHVLQPKVKDIQSVADIISMYVKNSEVKIGWFYSASFISLLSSFKFEKIIYDCMDELSLFKGVDQELIDQEKRLMEEADIVFTGGKSLFEVRKELHPNVYCFPSSVDEAHFAQALNGIAIPPEIASISSPVVGYFGVIDERLDLSLLHETAKLLPNVSFVLIGPVAKIKQQDLPKEDNIHYLGMRSYSELPAYLKAFDIAVMPFAINDATKHISPIKTLEYMAAGKPIISTKITDVVRDYSSCVNMVETPDDFVQVINFLLEKSDQLSLQLEYYEILTNTSWDSTASRMQSIIKTFVK